MGGGFGVVAKLGRELFYLIAPRVRQSLRSGVTESNLTKTDDLLGLWRIDLYGSRPIAHAGFNVALNELYFSTADPRAPVVAVELQFLIKLTSGRFKSARPQQHLS